MTPEISVIIPTYNRAHYLPQTLDSVLAQTFTDYEIIIVDDGSTDETHSVVATYQKTHLQIQYIYQENAGGSAARNHGFAKSCGEYILFLDSDDLLLPSALQLLWEAVEQTPDAGLIGARYQYIDNNLCTLGESNFGNLSQPVDLISLLRSCPFIPSASIINRKCFHQVGGFDITQVAAQDWDLWVRIASIRCHLYWVNNIVSQYRLHTESLTSNLRRQKQGIFQMLDKVFDSQQVTEEIAQKRNEIYMLSCIYVTARAYGENQVDLAHECWSFMQKTSPDWIKSGLVLERILRQGTNILVTTQPSTYQQIVLNNLPDDVCSRIVYHRALARIHAADLFLKYQQQDWHQIGFLWWSMVKNDPTWLKNLGVWSIGTRYLLKKIIGQIHSTGSITSQ